jgi:hypothetical protein
MHAAQHPTPLQRSRAYCSGSHKVTHGRLHRTPYAVWAASEGGPKNQKKFVHGGRGLAYPTLLEVDIVELE